MSVLITNIKSIFGLNDKPHSLKKGVAMSHLGQIDNAYLLIENGLIKSYGAMADVPERAEKIIDANQGILLPSWCDSHTHIVYAGSREQEFVYRIKGMTYEEIANQGGGILNSAKNMATADEETLFEAAYGRLQEIISMGTGALETKSGYGLSLESELKILRVIRRLKENTDIPIKASFLGAHAVPVEYQSRRQDYINLVKDVMLPKAVDEGLVDYIDVFCDKGFFTVDETDQILSAASKYGLRAKIHANELANSGGVQIGIKHNALSVDHLEMIENEEIEALKNSNTIPTVLPSCSFYLNIKYAPARKMIDEGLGIALATDYNPGSTPSGNVPFLLSLACNKMKLLPEEAINAATINGACAMELEKDHGSITIGKKANVIITKPLPSLAFLPYAFGSNHIAKVLINGKVV